MLRATSLTKTSKQIVWVQVYCDARTDSVAPGNVYNKLKHCSIILGFWDINWTEQVISLYATGWYHWWSQFEVVLIEGVQCGTFLIVGRCVFCWGHDVIGEAVKINAAWLVAMKKCEVTQDRHFLAWHLHRLTAMKLTQLTFPANTNFPCCCHISHHCHRTQCEINMGDLLLCAVLLALPNERSDGTRHLGFLFLAVLWHIQES